LAVRATPFALLKNSRKTQRAAGLFPASLAVRATPFALLKNSRKTERAAGLFPTTLPVRAAPFALLRIHREMPASITDAAQLGAIDCAAPQVSKIGMWSVQPIKANSPVAAANTAATEA
jgi:hypothetical protein